MKRQKNYKVIKPVFIIVSFILFFLNNSLNSLVINEGFLDFLIIIFSFIITFILLSFLKIKNLKWHLSLFIALTITTIISFFNVNVYSKNNKIEKHKIDVNQISVIKKDNRIKVYYEFNNRLNSCSGESLKDNYDINYKNQNSFKNKFLVELSIRKGLFSTFVLENKIEIKEK